MRSHDGKVDPTLIHLIVRASYCSLGVSGLWVSSCWTNDRTEAELFHPGLAPRKDHKSPHLDFHLCYSLCKTLYRLFCKGRRQTLAWFRFVCCLRTLWKSLGDTNQGPVETQFSPSCSCWSALSLSQTNWRIYLCWKNHSRQMAAIFGRHQDQVCTLLAHLQIFWLDQGSAFVSQTMILNCYEAF